MFIEVLTIIALLAVGAVGWWVYQNHSEAAVARRREREAIQRDFERPDHARAYEIAKIQADLSRWSGPH